MTDFFPMGRLLQFRTAFVTYNIFRLRELIRYLPKKKFELFQNIPFWLHVNWPQVPGYSDSPQTPCGIYRFHDSGFYRQAIQQYRLKQRLNTKPRSAEQNDIIGLYLMGSAGTLAQTDQSDFDYWIVVDGLAGQRRELFQEKLDRIKAWSRERFDQEVGFFVLSLADVRENKFAAVDEESSGSAQRTFLKEEFYRTFIMIAGKIPYWAVLPAKISDAEYDQWIRCAQQSRSIQFDPEDYVNLGNLVSIGPEECLGALLWQMFKARKYPVKSLIKAGLIAHCYFLGHQHGLLCDGIKEQYGRIASGNQLIDPYAAVFEAAIHLFQSLEDQDGLSLVRDCIFLRLSDAFQPGARERLSPKRRLLERYLSEWGWNETHVKQMARFNGWTESTRLAFEERIFNKLGFLYELVLRAYDVPNSTLSMTPDDLTSLKNRISAAVTKKPGKLPRCSAYLQAHMKDFVFQVNGHANDVGQEIWSVYHHAGEMRQARHLVYSGFELLRVVGWLIFNGFFTAAKGGLQYQTYQLPISPQRLKRLADEVNRFCDIGPVSPSALLFAPQWQKICVLLRPLAGDPERRLSGADLLAVNSWGELFFESIALAHIDGVSAICYKISEYLWRYCQELKGGPLPYRVFQVHGSLDMAFPRMIESGLARFRKPGTDCCCRIFPPTPENEEDEKPWLDLL